MSYYYLTTSQYDAISGSVSHGPAWTLDKSHCIVHNDNNTAITDYVSYYSSSTAVNNWRFASGSTEWQNWMTQDEFNGNI